MRGWASEAQHPPLSCRNCSPHFILLPRRTRCLSDCSTWVVPDRWIFSKSSLTDTPQICAPLCVTLSSSYQEAQFFSTRWSEPNGRTCWKERTVPQSEPRPQAVTCSSGNLLVPRGTAGAACQVRETRALASTSPADSLPIPRSRATLLTRG